MAKNDPLDTPMMRQYLATKADHPDCLLFMRMGDFYEIFLDDAVIASRVLGITLTSRNKGEAQEVPMAGVPHHSLAQHMPKLLASGHRVAIMDQLEDPKLAKGLVKRGLSRIVTAGTCIDEELLDAGNERLLVAISGLSDTIGVAACDVAGGSIWVESCHGLSELALTLARWQAAEILVPEAWSEQAPTILGPLYDDRPLPPIAEFGGKDWQHADGYRYLCQQLGVAALDGYGIGSEDGALAAAAAAALRYAHRNAGAELGHLRRLSRISSSDYLVIDSHCQRTLDIVRNQRDGGRGNTLLATVDRCRTAPGSRLLARWLSRPLAKPQPIIDRHAAVAYLLSEDALRADVISALNEVYDLERLLGRLASGRAGPRDLVQLASSLRAAVAVGEVSHGHNLPTFFQQQIPLLNPAPELADDIATTIVDEPPLNLNDGNIIRDGVDDEIDELRQLRSGAGAWLAAYQTEQASAIGLKSLKVGYNKIFGYFLEIGKQHADRLPDTYIRKQTLVGAERYITPELKEYEDKVLSAEDRLRNRERILIEAVRERVLAVLPNLQYTADALSTIDVLASLAEVARRGDWCRPEIDQSTQLDLINARHPVVEQVLGPGRFVANDCLLDAEAEAGPRLVVITGPNMAGKSTYIRQIALAVILAQAGSFVPASSARIGIVDRLFSRIGAGDELARNLSTFMVEMAETAMILNHASKRSLVVLDEVGRGTSTFDGLSLAWAITEYIHDTIGCRCLFATHYHELTDLAGEREGISNRTVSVAEEDDDVIFLHRIVAGAATKSYGIHVARLAGVPHPVINRAREVLTTLDDLNIRLSNQQGAPATASQRSEPVQLSLFQWTASPIVEGLANIDVDNLSPRAAWDLLATLHQQARKELRL